MHAPMLLHPPRNFPRSAIPTWILPRTASSISTNNKLHVINLISRSLGMKSTIKKKHKHIQKQIVRNEKINKRTEKRIYKKKQADKATLLRLHERSLNVDTRPSIETLPKSTALTVRAAYQEKQQLLVQQRTSLKLPPLPNIGDVIRLYGLRARQQLSQNFLLDLQLTDKIVHQVGDLTNCTVIEVGSGPGSLTRSLLHLGAKKVIAVEKDERFMPVLEALRQASGGRVELHFADMLEVDEAKLLEQYGVEKGEPVKIVANLPFNIGTQLLLKWLRQMHPERKGAFSYDPHCALLLLFQKEVADRIVAPVSSSCYSRLSVMVQRLATAVSPMEIPGRAFLPRPKVSTKLVLITPHDSVRGRESVSTKALELVLKKIFAQRRKILSNSVKFAFGASGASDIFKLSGIDPSQRPQELTVEQWCELTYGYLQVLKRKYEQLPVEAEVVDTYNESLDDENQEENSEENNNELINGNEEVVEEKRSIEELD